MSAIERGSSPRNDYWPDWRGVKEFHVFPWRTDQPRTEFNRPAVTWSPPYQTSRQLEVDKSEAVVASRARGDMRAGGTNLGGRATDEARPRVRMFRGL